MKRLLSFFVLTSLLVICSIGCAPAAKVAPTPTSVPPTQTALPATSTPDPAVFLGNLHWFGTAAILYHGSQTIYFDPVGLSGSLPPADLILISHGHSDHWSIPDIKKVIGPTRS